MSNNKVNENGIILYAGINEYDIEIFKIFIPKICLNQFYYNCGKVFVIDRFVNLFDDINAQRLLNPTLPYIFYIQVDAILGENFTGHVSNLIYIPNAENAVAENLETMQYGKFYCVQSFIYQYNTFSPRKINWQSRP